MSDTPRTDAEEGKAFIGVYEGFDSQDVIRAYDFARQLERELTAAQAENTRLHADVIDLSGRLKEKLEAIDAAQAEALKLQEENARLQERIARLEEAGDRMAAAWDKEWLTQADAEAIIDDWYEAKDTQ